MRPRRLRGSFVSLLLWEGRSVTYVAAQIGCSVATLARHYAGGSLSSRVSLEFPLRMQSALRAPKLGLVAGVTWAQPALGNSGHEWELHDNPKEPTRRENVPTHALPCRRAASMVRKGLGFESPREL